MELQGEVNSPGRKQQKKEDTSKPLLVQLRINNYLSSKALLDSGCDYYAVINEDLVHQLQLPIVDRKQRTVRTCSDEAGTVRTRGVAGLTIEIGGHEERIVAHVIRNLGQDLFLGKPWMEHNQVCLDLGKQRLLHRNAGISIRFAGEPEPEQITHARNAKLVTASTFLAERRRILRTRRGEAVHAIRAISLQDIEKALKKKEPKDPSVYVPSFLLKKFPTLFSETEAQKLPPHRPGVDHEVHLQRDHLGQEPTLPWGPLYDMSREELLVLRKTLSELLDKGFIRASGSPAAAPVLFVKKPGGGLRFCCDYRALNAITKKDRYPLPLIAETLRNISAAKWLTKLDVVAAFHKLRMAPGHEEKTAFRTRFGLFEWKVCPFGLSGAPASFQRYINSVLREHLDHYATAYMDDVLVYTSGTRSDHLAKVQQVLSSLEKAGLHLDPAKCVFATKEVKYLGFIVTVGKGISCDPEKQRAIREWEAPRSVKGVQSFLGFANYYRIFIPDFAEISAPLVTLTKKGALFTWKHTEQAAFELLKTRFCEAPVLKAWDPEHPTFVEPDASGFAVGGVLTQEDPTGGRRVVAYYSKRLLPAERNYPIHDKELLAIIRCLQAWRAELTSCASFTILSDHKNLKYFMTKRMLSERQVRWAEILSRFNFDLMYRPGRENAAPDALSRREQDQPPKGEEYEEGGKFRQLLAPSQVNRLEAAAPPPRAPPLENPELQTLWEETLPLDATYQGAVEAIKKGERRFPPTLNLKIQKSECELDPQGFLRFRGRLWVPACSQEDHPDPERLRTLIVQSHHSSALAGHPGQDGTFELVARRFFWPGQSKLVRRYVDNCSTCGRNHLWREKKRGLLKPLPIPQRPRSELAMDFITDLPASNKSGSKYLWVIVDRLTKATTLEPMTSMKAEACAERFLTCHYRFHGWPSSIVSDRGSNWVSRFWRRLCELAGIKQLLSTAYHPQTDGGPERRNQEIQAYLRCYISFAQDDWEDFLPAAMLSLNSRNNAATGISPFFIEHGYHMEPIPISDHDADKKRESPEARASQLMRKLQQVREFTQVALAASQAKMEDSANKKRQPAEELRVGDKVWLDMRNYRSQRPSKKLDALHQKYEVIKVASPYVVELSVPEGIYPRFHVDQLKRVRNNPLPSQEDDDQQPPPITIEGEKEWLVERILCARWQKRGRGKTRQCLVKWIGYSKPNWEPLSAVEDTEALDRFEDEFGRATENDGPRHLYDKSATKTSVTK